jgi:hypothetical protein
MQRDTAQTHTSDLFSNLAISRIELVLSLTIRVGQGPSQPKSMLERPGQGRSANKVANHEIRFQR